MSEESIAQEAERLVYGDRGFDYDHPLDNFTKIGKFWGTVLQIGRDVTPEEVAMMMILVKISREMHRHKKDNLIDGVGYFLTLDRIYEERELRATLSMIASDTLEDLPF